MLRTVAAICAVLMPSAAHTEHSDSSTLNANASMTALNVIWYLVEATEKFPSCSGWVLLLRPPFFFFFFFFGGGGGVSK